jgi:hypothetical protein
MKVVSSTNQRRNHHYVTFEIKYAAKKEQKATKQTAEVSNSDVDGNFIRNPIKSDFSHIKYLISFI